MQSWELGKSVGRGWLFSCALKTGRASAMMMTTHTFNGPFSGTTQVSRYQKVKTNLDFTDSEWQWHLLGHMQVCTSLQSDNHASTPPLSFLQTGCPSCRPTNSVKALNINALRINLVNIDIVDRSQAKPDQDRTWSLKSQTRLGVSRHRLRQYWSLATQTGRLGALRPRPRQDLEFPDPN